MAQSRRPWTVEDRLISVAMGLAAVLVYGWIMRGVWWVFGWGWGLW